MLDAIAGFATRAAHRNALAPACAAALQQLVDGLRSVLPPAP